MSTENNLTACKNVKINNCLNRKLDYTKLLSNIFNFKPCFCLPLVLQNFIYGIVNFKKAAISWQFENHVKQRILVEPLDNDGTGNDE